MIQKTYKHRHTACMHACMMVSHKDMLTLPEKSYFCCNKKIYNYKIDGNNEDF